MNATTGIVHLDTKLAKELAALERAQTARDTAWVTYEDSGEDEDYRRYDCAENRVQVARRALSDARARYGY